MTNGTIEIYTVKNTQNEVIAFCNADAGAYEKINEFNQSLNNNDFSLNKEKSDITTCLVMEDKRLVQLNGVLVPKSVIKKFDRQKTQQVNVLNGSIAVLKRLIEIYPNEDYLKKTLALIEDEIKTAENEKIETFDIEMLKEDYKFF